MTDKHAGGRPKLRSKGLTVDQWLQGYLSGGSRPVDEIRQVAKLNEFGWRTVERAKRLLGITSKKVLYTWHWMDRSVPDPNPKPEDTKNEIAKLKQDVKELTRLSQAPQQIGENGPVQIDLKAVDGDGYLTTTPAALGLAFKDNITPYDIFNRIRTKLKEGRSVDGITREMFDWAYPDAGFSESVLAKMLRSNGVKVGPKHIVFGSKNDGQNAAQNVKAGSCDVSF